RQMRLEVVVAGSLPFAAIGKGRHRLLAGVDKIRDERFVLHALVPVRRLDRIEIGLRKLRVLERKVGEPRNACRALVARLLERSSLIWIRIATKPSSATAACAICASVPYFCQKVAGCVVKSPTPRQPC